MKYYWCCADCGSTNVQIQAWVDVNTYEFVEDIQPYDNHHIWCEDCEDHVELQEKPAQLGFNFEADKKCP